MLNNVARDSVHIPLSRAIPTNTQRTENGTMAKHLNNYKEADTGLSYIWDALSARKREPRHAAPVLAVRDVWAGNPDTDKFWAKGE